MKYKVQAQQIITYEIELEANSTDEAQTLALETNHFSDWQETFADYEIISINPTNQ
jgi:hypothetical protein